MGDVVILPVETTLDIPADRVLTGAMSANLTGAVVIGWDERGDFYFASSLADGGNVLWLMEQAKIRLLEVGDSPGRHPRQN